MKRVVGPDTVRALAALSVMLAHLIGPFLPGPLRYVFTGLPAVIAFFVISGFCIHYPYRGGNFLALPFLVARALRILIPSIIAFACAQALGMKAYNFFADGFILWSIVCEMFYYVCYPALRRIAGFTGWYAMIAISLCISYGIVLSLGSDKYGNIHIYGWYLNWIVMLPAWLVGAALAQHFDSLPRLNYVWLWRAVAAGTASILYWATLNTPAGFYLTMNPFSAIVVLWLLAEIGAAKPNAVTERIGRWSYSIYLVHTIAATVLYKLLHSSNPLLAVPFALACAYAFYLVIERPAHRLARRTFAKMRASAAAPVAGAVG